LRKVRTRVAQSVERRNHPSVRPHSTVLLLLVGLAVPCLGCGSSLIPLTEELRQQHDLTEEELANLQYYVSDTITLRRELESGSRQVTGSHTLLLTSGKAVEEVVVEDETPGVAVRIEPGGLAISFEEGTFLLFATRTDGDLGLAPAESGGAFAPPVVRRAAGTGKYFLLVDGTGRVTFQGRAFEAQGDSFRAHLLIDAESLEEVVESRTVLKGRTLGD
jgi:hypothetical protein